MKMNYTIFAIVLIASLFIAGCVQRPPYASPSPTSTPTLAPSPSPSPEPSPPAPPEDKVWVEVFPIQCLENPWEQDWFKGRETVPYPAYKENEIIKNFYQKFGITVYEIEKTKFADVVCLACSCGNGYKLEFLVDEGDANKIDGKGNVIEEISQELQVSSESTCTLQNESAIIQLRSPTVFRIIAFLPNNRLDVSATWKSGEGWVEVNFESAPSKKDCIICVGAEIVQCTFCDDCVGSTVVETALDFTPIFWAAPPQKLIVKHNGKIIAEKVFEGMFCGGIAAFPCPSFYDCKLDGVYPDAGGKCVANFGFLKGKVTIGPICPVERPDQPCPVPPEAYESRKILVYKEDGKTLEKEISIDFTTGNYNALLAPGAYIVDINRAGIDSSGDVPKKITIESGKTVTLNIDIDTGIR